MAKTHIAFSFFWSFGVVMLCVKADQYEYFQMVQQWPPATCSGVGVTCGKRPLSMFTIHGSWPSNYSKAHLVCTGPPFSLAQISPLSKQLNTFWPNVIRENNPMFWKHEWEKHGACSDPPLNQFQYFQATLTIRTTYDLLAILKAAGLGPSATTVRQYQDIVRAIESATGKKPALRCNNNAQTRKSQLHEIILCIDRDGATLIHCNKSAAISCPSEFVWLDRQALSLGGYIGEFKMEFLVYEFSIGKLLFVFVSISIAFVFWKRFFQNPRGVGAAGKQE